MSSKAFPTVQDGCPQLILYKSVGLVHLPLQPDDIGINPAWSSFQVHQFLARCFPALFDYFNRAYPDRHLLREAEHLGTPPWASVKLPYHLLSKKNRDFQLKSSDGHPNGSVIVETSCRTRGGKLIASAKDRKLHLSTQFSLCFITCRSLTYFYTVFEDAVDVTEWPTQPKAGLGLDFVPIPLLTASTADTDPAHDTPAMKIETEEPHFISSDVEMSEHQSDNDGESGSDADDLVLVRGQHEASSKRARSGESESHNTRLATYSMLPMALS